MSDQAYGPDAGRLPATLWRYLAGEFLRVFGLCMAAFVAIYILVDFFDRFANFVKYGATIEQMARYFFFKIPLIFTQCTPMAVLSATLLSLGGLSRHSEITAMYACGISRMQLVAPLAVTCLLLTFVTLAWNETVVPRAYRHQRQIYNVEIKGKDLPTQFATTELWSHGEDSFFHVRIFDDRRLVLVGVRLLEIDPSFRLQRVLEIPSARWDGEDWFYEAGTERLFGAEGEIETVKLGPGVLDIREKPTDMKIARRKGEEYSYGELADLIANLQRKGLDPTDYRVDLHLKMAVPFLNVVMALIAIPYGVRNLRSSSLAANIGMGLFIGISYWFVLALAISLGRSGAIPPAVGAWAANAIFTGIGAFLLLER